MKILILASNPHKDLNLDDELRIVQGELERTAKREQFPVVKEVGVRVGDLQRLVLQHRPEIIHFCGHGSGAEGLIFKVDGGGEQRVRADALATLFGLCKFVKCVLLNACYSEEQALAIARHTEYVIGMSKTIQDNAAIAFSKGFYTALGNDCSIELSFAFGKNAIQLEVSGSSIKRSRAAAVEERKAEVVDVVNRTELKEHEKPRIFINGKELLASDLDPRGANQSMSEAKREEVLLKIDESLGEATVEARASSEEEEKRPELPVEESENLKQYREIVKTHLSDSRLTVIEEVEIETKALDLALSKESAAKILEEEKVAHYRSLLKSYVADVARRQPGWKEQLEKIRQDIRLSDQSAEDILDIELAPIKEAQQKYANFLNLIIERVPYPFGKEVQASLAKQQQGRALTNAEVSEISAPILQKAEEWHQQKMQRYEQEFIRAISSGYPIDSFVRDGLNQFQQSLELSDAEVGRIEAPLIAPKKAAYEQRLAEEQRRKEAEAERQDELERQRQVKRQQAVFSFEVMSVDAKGNISKKEQGSAEYSREGLGQGVDLDLVLIPGGTFQIGSAAGQGYDDEWPQHEVKVPAFRMGKYPITQAQWRAVASFSQVALELNPEPAYFRGDERPVEQVSWDEATEFCQRLSQHTGREYRLPSEAEWEYACRAGTRTPFHFGETLTSKLANYRAISTYGSGSKGEYREQTTNVGSFFANEFGLYDMHGNVWEWCQDPWHKNYEGAPVDGSARKANDINGLRLVRGGSWDDHPDNCRSASRYKYARASRNDLLGFRVVCASS